MGLIPQSEVEAAKARVKIKRAQRRLELAAPELLKQLEEAQRELYALAGEPIGSGRYRQIDEAIKTAKGT